MSTTPVTYVGPFDEIAISGLPFTVKQGETFDCPIDLAKGEPPTGKPYIDAEGSPTDDEAKSIGPNAAYNAGTSGLLAQTDNWKAGKAAKRGSDD